ncbi:MAG: cell division protein FtsZ [bacterium]|nr:cell division protein FtsZ [bacterium]
MAKSKKNKKTVPVVKKTPIKKHVAKKPVFSRIEKEFPIRPVVVRKSAKKRKKSNPSNFFASPIENLTLSKKIRDGRAIIKVIGVGGGGGNAVTRMMTSGDRLRDVEFIAVNTDSQDLNYASAHKKFYIGRALTKGLGAGMNPEIGKQAAEENRSELSEALDGADIVFLTAGFGGGTGTGATPVIAELAKEKGILTIAIVTKPFAFEGSQRMNIAQDGIARLKDKVDALVVIPNDRVFSIIDKDTSINKAFSFIDEVLKNGVMAISELISAPGIINVDFADIKATMKDSGTTMIGIGSASGQDRGSKAVSAAINSPLLEISIDGAKGVLFSIAGGRDMKMAEIHEIAKAVSANVDPSARIIFGAYYDRRLSDKQIKVTVIATGFNGFYSGNQIQGPSLFMDQMMKTRNNMSSVVNNKEPEKRMPFEKFEKKETEDDSKSLFEEKENDTAKDIKKEKPKEDSWDIPAFLRKKKR